MRIGAMTDIGRYRKLNEDSYFIYRNDSTALGKSKSDMLRYLWSLCPNYYKETYTDESESNKNYFTVNLTQKENNFKKLDSY